MLNEFVFVYSVDTLAVLDSDVNVKLDLRVMDTFAGQIATWTVGRIVI